MEILNRDNNIYNLIYFANIYHSLEDIYQVGDISMKQQNHMALPLAVISKCLPFAEH